MSVSHCTTSLKEERLQALVLALAGQPPLRERVAAFRDAGSFGGALRVLGLSTAPARARAERTLGRVEARGYGILCLGDPSYPLLLSEAPDPPLVLTVRGSFLREDALALAIVGSRRATPYGRETSRRLARDLASAGLTIVSGLARGVDGAAHEGALEAGGRTLAVLGSGLDDIYPREHRKLAERIAGQGAILSEFDLDEPPHARNFPRRNRVITGLALGTLVVEAAAKSGSLISARMALDQNREVFAVPGPVTSLLSEGTHALLRDGARLVTRAEDVLEELRPEVQEALAPVRRPEQARAELDEEERKVLERLSDTHDALDLDQILSSVPLAIDRVLAALTRLQVLGRISSLAGGLYRARRP
jgi:DNA processing protein